MSHTIVNKSNHHATLLKHHDNEYELLTNAESSAQMIMEVRDATIQTDQKCSLANALLYQLLQTVVAHLSIIL